MSPNKRAAAYKLAYEEKTGGVINYGRVVKALKAVFEKYPNDDWLFRAFKLYLAQTETKYVSIERFAEKVGAYMPIEEAKVHDPYSD